MNTDHSCVGMFLEADGGPSGATLTLNGTGAMTIDGGASGHDQQGFLVANQRNLKIFTKLTGPGGVSWGQGGGGSRNHQRITCEGLPDLAETKKRRHTGGAQNTEIRGQQSVVVDFLHV
jgi:hypothetical protein